MKVLRLKISSDSRLKINESKLQIPAVLSRQIRLKSFQPCDDGPALLLFLSGQFNCLIETVVHDGEDKERNGSGWGSTVSYSPIP